MIIKLFNTSHYNLYNPFCTTSLSREVFEIQEFLYRESFDYTNAVDEYGVNHIQITRNKCLRLRRAKKLMDDATNDLLKKYRYDVPSLRINL